MSEKCETKLRVETLSLTPELAESFLSSSQKANWRRASPRTTRTYARFMSERLWKENGDTLKFDCNGNLIDGQHRCMAVISSNTTIPVIVVRNIPHDAVHTLDQGRARKFYEMLEHRDIPHARTVSGMVSLFWKQSIGNFFNNEHVHRGMPFGHGPALDELWECYDENREMITKWAPHANIPDTAPYIWRGSMGAYLFCIFDKINPEKAQMFYEAMKTGANLSEKHPVFILRKKIFENNMKRKRFSLLEKAALTVKAWNCFNEDRLEINTLKYGIRETFPKISGFDYPEETKEEEEEEKPKRFRSKTA